MKDFENICYWAARMQNMERSHLTTQSVSQTHNFFKMSNSNQPSYIYTYKYINIFYTLFNKRAFQRTKFHTFSRIPFHTSITYISSTIMTARSIRYHIVISYQHYQYNSTAIFGTITYYEEENLLLAPYSTCT